MLSDAALENLLATLINEVRTLDEDMKAFKLLDRPLYDNYVQVRKIISPGAAAARRRNQP